VSTPGGTQYGGAQYTVRSFRARRVLAALLALPVIELAIAIAVAGWIGIWPTVIALFLLSATGFLVLRREGRQAWRALGGQPVTPGEGLRRRDPADAALVALAERRADFSSFEAFGFAGHALTGAEMVAAIEAATRSKFNVRMMGWWFLKTFGQFLAMGREISELEYLWGVPHRISGDKLGRAIGEFPATPIPKAIAASLRELGFRA